MNKAKTSQWVLSHSLLCLDRVLFGALRTLISLPDVARASRWAGANALSDTLPASFSSLVVLNDL